jgi:hypothetical protein
MNNKFHEQHIGEQQHLVNIDHSILNLEPMIRKMKIDVIMNRIADENHYTEYLNFTKNFEIKDIKYIDHLFLAQLLTKKLTLTNF